jgi:hypothetical protein
MVCAALKPDTTSICERMNSKMRGKMLTSTTNDNNSRTHLAIGTIIESGNECKGVVCGEKTLKNRNRARWERMWSDFVCARRRLRLEKLSTIIYRGLVQAGVNTTPKAVVIPQVVRSLVTGDARICR